FLVRSHQPATKYQDGHDQRQRSHELFHRTPPFEVALQTYPRARFSGYGKAKATKKGKILRTAPTYLDAARKLLGGGFRIIAAFNIVITKKAGVRRAVGCDYADKTPGASRRKRGKYSFGANDS